MPTWRDPPEPQPPMGVQLRIHIGPVVIAVLLGLVIYLAGPVAILTAADITAQARDKWDLVFRMFSK